jgi:hypothetical protein
MSQRHAPASLLRPLTATVLLTLSLACEPASPPDPCADVEQTPLAPREGFDPRSTARRVDCGFRSGVLHIDAAPDGSMWLLHSEFPDSSFSAPSTKLLTHFSAEGQRLTSLELPDFVSRFAVHPSGELTVIGWGRVEDKKTVRLRRIRADGSLVAERLFANDTPPEDRISYSAFANGTVQRTARPEAERTVGILAVEAYGEDAYLFANTDGLRIYRLDSALETRWFRTIAPTVALVGVSNAEAQALGAPFNGFPMSVDEAGRPHIAMPLLQVGRLAYKDVFGGEPEGPAGRAILLASVGSGGEPGTARTIPTDTAETIVGLSVREGAFAVGAHKKTPIDQPDKHFDSDLFFASGRLDRPASELVLRSHSLDNDDVPSAMVACQGGYCFAGQTGAVTRDRGRDTTTQARGFILTVDAQGEQKGLALFQGLRDTDILRATEAPGGRVAFTFLTDEPPVVGSAPASRKGNELWLGVFGAP